jgi:tetratricopeptide (TPR) repeat protein
MAIAALVCAIASSIGCRSTPEPAIAFEVEPSGCASIDGRGTCELAADRALRLWVSAPEGTQIVFEGAAGAAGEAAEGGALHRLVVARGAAQVVVVARRGRAIGHWTLRVADAHASKSLERARALRDGAHLDEAADLARGDLLAPSAVDRARAAGFLARIALARGRAEEASALFRQAIALDRVADLPTDAADDAFALAYVLTDRLPRFAEARAVLRDVADVDAPDARARVPYYQGIIDAATGQYRSALSRLRDARARARRLGNLRLEQNAANKIALVLQTIGRAEESIAILRELKDDPRTPVPDCEKVLVLTSLGWTSLLARESDRARTGHPPPDPIEPLEAALRYFPDRCADSFSHANVLTNLALAAALGGDAAAARTWLERARASMRDRSPSLELWWLDIEGQLALAKGDARASIRAYDEAAGRAATMLDASVEWRATVGRAEALLALGRTAEALAAYEHAEALLGDGSLAVPLGEGRGAFLADRERSARERVDLLLRLGRVGDAMNAAHASWARALGGLERAERLERLSADAREKWEAALAEYRRRREAILARAEAEWALPSDELARSRARHAPEEAEARAALDAALAAFALGAPLATPMPERTADVVTLSFHPTRDGWAIFAERGASREAYRVADVAGRSADALALELLRPMKGLIAGARRVHVLAYGALGSVDFHAASPFGAPLGEQAIVEYLVGLPPQRDEAHARRALVVADPNRNLPGAAREAEDLAGALRERGWEVTLLAGLAARRADVSRALERVDLFHYAGHGAFGGRDGWDTVLSLAYREELTIADALALRHAPRFAVLSSCESGRASDDAPAGLGMAQALLAAGAEVVVAPTRSVRDALAAQMMRALYMHMQADGNVDLAAALRDAQLEVRARSKEEDWAAFRAITR